MIDDDEVDDLTVMKRNAASTRERILEAATFEFAAHGVAGARVDRIAKASGGSKNLIYMYYGSKEGLFNAVLDHHERRFTEAMPFTVDDLPGFAVRLFDYAASHPELMQLTAWFSLQGEPTQEIAAAHRLKLRAIERAQKDGTLSRILPPAALLNTVLTLAFSWTAANPFARTIDPSFRKRLRIYRKTVEQSVRLLVTPKP